VQVAAAQAILQLNPNYKPECRRQTC